MSRYIDADLLYEETEKKIKANHECRMAVVDDEFLDLINDAPTEDVVEVRRGEWIEDDFTKIIKCGICDNDAPISTISGEQYKSKYCQYCGAKMDGERKEL